MSLPQVAERLYTYDDLASVPDDGQRYEIIGGELIVSPSPTLVHQRVAFQLARLLADYVDSLGLGEVYIAPSDVKLTPIDVVVPDIFFVVEDRADRIGDDLLTFAPDLAVEVLSPSTRRTDTLKKQALYQNHGVREYWIVDPEKQIVEVLALQDGLFHPVPQREGEIVSLIFPQLRLARADVFRRRRR